MLKKKVFDPKGKRFLAITAHPDDLDFAAGATLLKWKNLGVKGSIVIATNGDKGSHDKNITSEKLKEIRKNEQLRASEMLGLENTWFLGYPDAQLEITQELKEKIVKIIRSYKPDIVFTWDPTLVYSIEKHMINHPDHRAIGQAVLDACFPLARDRLIFEEHEKNGLSSHCVTDFFLFNFDKSNYFEDVSEFIDKKIELLKIHKSQINEKTISGIITQWARETGKKTNLPSAEGFVYLRLKTD